MATVTGSAITTLARQRANMENTQFVTDLEVLGLCNLAYQELYDVIVAIDPTYFATPSSTFSVTSTGTAALGTVASGCYKPLKMEYYTGGSGTGYVDVPLVGFHDVNSVYVRSWALMGSTLYFYPPQYAPGTYRLWYVPEATTWGTSTAATVELYNGWQEYVACDVAAKCIAKAEGDPTPALAGKAAAKARIEQVATRTLQDPPTCVDIYPPGKRWWYA